VYERLSPEGLEAVHLAEAEARKMGHDYLGTEHLLLGLLAQVQTRAARTLRALGVEPGHVRSETERTVGPGEGGQSDSLLLTPLALRALERTVGEADGRQEGLASPEDLLLGLSGVPDGLAVRILTKMDVSPEQIREALTRVSGSGIDPRP
jgi:ATP-dependent Clp protease ATP-binding subunit ClpC